MGSATGALTVLRRPCIVTPLRRRMLGCESNRRPGSWLSEIRL